MLVISRLAGIIGWTALWFVLWSSGVLLTLALPRVRLRWRQLAVRSWARGVCRIIGLRRHPTGRPPPPPFLLASNHLSYLDILLLYSSVRGVFVAKRDMRSWPVLGALAQLVGTIWVRRERRRDALRVLDRIAAAIARGDGVMLFPEGTTSAGAGLLPLKPALLEWAARARYPVHYATISYRTTPGGPPASRALCWWGSMPFGRHALQVLALPHFHGEVAFASEPILAATRSELADRLQQALSARLIPVT